jgi:uncharacterized protein YecT (DUF1311 family)
MTPAQIIACVAIVSAELIYSGQLVAEPRPECIPTPNNCEQGEPAESCVSRLAQRADQLLNQKYVALKGEIKKVWATFPRDPTKVLKDLTASERAWIAHRNASCNVASELPGGGASGMYEYGCLCLTSYQRIDDFILYEENLGIPRVGQR